MKKLLLMLLCTIILSVSAFAAEKPYGYYDTDRDGFVKINDTMSLLRRMLNNKEEKITLIHVVQTMKIAAMSAVADATVTDVDPDAQTVTFSTTCGDGITVPFAVLGIESAFEVTDSMTAILTVERPVSADSEVYAAKMNARLDVSESANNKPISIKSLNTKSENGSHVNDDYKTSSVEVNYREILNLTKADHHRYRLAFYPRVKKVKDDLYIMSHHVNELGAHVYFTSSSDGVNWKDPIVMYNNTADYAFLAAYTEGPLAGKTDRLAAVNPDMCVLDNGDILYVYAIRPTSGYRYYPDLSGLYIMRGKVNKNNSITWSKATQITVGQVWEPFIWQRDDGQVEIYWSNAAPYMIKYGYDINVRSAGVSMIVSNDNGYTWSPTIEEGKANGYLFKRVYNEYIGDTYGEGADGNPLSETPLPYFAGQMPAVTRLYNGRSLLAVEVRQLNGTYDFSYAISKEGGEWDSLALTEDGPSGAKKSIFDAAGPYLATFPSGEVYLTYHWSGKQYFKMGDPSGAGFTTERYIAAPGAGGMWGSSELVGSHEVITAAQLKTKVVTESEVEGEEPTVTYEYGIELVHSYLNHRTNAQKFAVLVDGYSSDWENNTDALFVGSESQAQISVQTAHDKNNVYFLISRFDEMLTTGDNAILRIAAGDNKYYRVTVSLDGSYSIVLCNGGIEIAVASGKGVSNVHGTIGDNTDTDEGVLTELAIPKSTLGLTNATSFAFAPMLTNIDDGNAIVDSLANADTFAYWPKVVLQ